MQTLKIFNRTALSVLLAASLLLGGVASVAEEKKMATAVEKAVAAEPASNVNYQPVAPLELVKNPALYMEKDVAFEGTFNRFSDMALDYKKAFRDSRDYVSMLILRPDVKDHEIPLSELKLFFPRKKSEDVTNLDSGDVVSIKGHVFSNALGEPWVDIAEIKVTVEKADEEGKTAGH